MAHSGMVWCGGSFLTLLAYPNAHCNLSSNFTCYCFWRAHSLSGCVSHHCHELVEINLAVAVDIDLCNGLVELLLGVHAAELLAREKFEQLAGVDLSAAVLIKHLEGGSEVGFASERLLVHCSRQELCHRVKGDPFY